MSSEPAQNRTPPKARLLGGIVVIAAAAVFGILLLADDEEGGSKASEPVAASQDDLRALSEERNRPVYWIGPEDGYTYELTEATDDNVYVRYLPPGAQVDNRNPDYTTIGTYPNQEAFQTITRARDRPGAKVTKAKDGGLAITYRKQAKSVYVAWPDVPVLVEVYDPDPRSALGLATSDQLVPVR